MVALAPGVFGSDGGFAPLLPGLNHLLNFGANGCAGWSGRCGRRSGGGTCCRGCSSCRCASRSCRRRRCPTLLLPPHGLAGFQGFDVRVSKQRQVRPLTISLFGSDYRGIERIARPSGKTASDALAGLFSSAIRPAPLRLECAQSAATKSSALRGSGCSAPIADRTRSARAAIKVGESFKPAVISNRLMPSAAASSLASWSISPRVST